MSKVTCHKEYTLTVNDPISTGELEIPGLEAVYATSSQRMYFSIGSGVDESRIQVYNPVDDSFITQIQLTYIAAIGGLLYVPEIDRIFAPSDRVIVVGSHVDRINPNTNLVDVTSPPLNGLEFASSASPFGSVYCPSTNALFVSLATRTIKVLDAATLAVLYTFPMQRFPFGNGAYVAATDRIWIPCTGGSFGHPQILVVNPNDYTYIATDTQNNIVPSDIHYVASLGLVFVGFYYSISPSTYIGGYQIYDAITGAYVDIVYLPDNLSGFNSRKHSNGLLYSSVGTLANSWLDCVLSRFDPATREFTQMDFGSSLAPNAYSCVEAVNVGKRYVLNAYSFISDHVFWETGF